MPNERPVLLGPLLSPLSRRERRQAGFLKSRAVQTVDSSKFPGHIPLTTYKDFFASARRNCLDAADQLPLHFQTVLNLDNQDDTQWQAFEKVLVDGTCLPADHPQLQTAWQYLTEKVEWATGEIIKNPQQAFATFFLAGAFISLVEENKVTKVARLIDNPAATRSSKRRAGHEFYAELWGADASKPRSKTPDSPALQLKAAINAFFEHLDTLDTPQNEKQAQALINVIDQLFFDETFRCTQFWRNYATDALQEQLNAKSEHLTQSIVSSPFLKSLLQQKEVIENIKGSFLLAILFTAAINTANVDHNIPETKKLLENFISLPEAPKEYWLQFAWYYFEATDRASLFDSSYQTHLDFASEVIIGFFRDCDSVTLAQFFATIPWQELQPKEANSLLRKLIGIYGYLKTTLPDHSNHAFLRSWIKTRAEMKGRYQELTILEDQKPGTIYINTSGEARTRLPQTGQTRQEFLDACQKEGLEIAYISQAPWREKPPEVPRPQVESITIEGTRRPDPYWGQLTWIDSAAQATNIVAQLNGSLGKLNQAQIEQELSQFQGKLQRTNPPIILPQFFPEGHFLRNLFKVGVLAIDHRGERVQIIIDCQKAGLADNGLVSIVSEPSIDGNLEIPQVAQEIYSNLHLLISWAAHFARTAQTPEPVIGQDLSLLRGLMKDYNRRVRAFKAGRLTESKTSETSGSREVIIPIGKKVTSLFLTPA